MTRDFAKKRSPAQKPRPRSQVPAWVWLFTGSVLGAFITFLVYLTKIPPQPSALPDTLSQVAPEPESEAEETPAEDPGDRSGPRFDFYQLLKESEVLVHPDPLPEEPETPESESAELQAPEYVLQVGSFKNAGDADRLRASLLLLNLDAKVETVKVRNAETWHRVLVGPFANRSAMNEARGTLANNEYESLLLERSADG